MTTDQKIVHAKCMINAARHYLNSAYADSVKDDQFATKEDVMKIIDPLDDAQWLANRLADRVTA